LKTKLIGDAAELLVGAFLSRLINGIEIKRLGGRYRFDLLIENVKNVPPQYRNVIRRDSYVEVKIRHNPKQWYGQGIPPNRKTFYENKEKALESGRDYILAYLFYGFNEARAKLWLKFIIFNADIVEDNWFIETRWSETKEEKVTQLSIKKILSLKPPQAIVFETEPPPLLP